MWPVRPGGLSLAHGLQAITQATMPPRVLRSSYGGVTKACAFVG